GSLRRRGRGVSAIAQAADAGFLGAMRTTVERAFGFDAVTNDCAIAMRATRCERRDRAFEAVERVALLVHRHGEALVVFVAAVFATCHERSPCLTREPTLVTIVARSDARRRRLSDTDARVSPTKHL